MELERPRFASRAEVFAHRPQHAQKVRFTGLWVAGTLRGLEAPTVAVVGARAPSDAARARARTLGAELGRAGVCVLSGLALGIDGAAHAGTLETGGLTIGILGGGHRQFFPRRNLGLAQAVLAAGGAVLSPFPPEEPARPGQFLQRNGVVAALADAVVVVEAAERSGALNTAGWAAALGIDVLAFPGDVDRPKAAGCNALIRDGATLVRHAGDVLAALGVAARAAGRPAFAEAEPARDEPLGAALLSALGRGPQTLETLLERTGEPASATLATLVQLELAGRLEQRRDTLEYALRER